MNTLTKISIFIMQIIVLFVGWFYASKVIEYSLHYIGIPKNVSDVLIIAMGCIVGWNWDTIWNKSIELFKKYTHW